MNDQELARLSAEMREAIVRIDSNNAHACAGVVQFARGERPAAVFVAQCADYKIVRAELLRLTHAQELLEGWVRVRDDRIADLCKDLMRAEAELAALKGFARDVMEAWPDGGVDGGELQDIALRHGLLEPSVPTQEERDEWGLCDTDDWYRRTALALLPVGGDRER